MKDLRFAVRSHGSLQPAEGPEPEVYQGPRTVFRGDVGRLLCLARWRLHGEDEVPLLEFLDVALQDPLHGPVEEEGINAFQQLEAVRAVQCLDAVEPGPLEGSD